MDRSDVYTRVGPPNGSALVRRGATPTLAEITRWIADLGGYTGKSSGGPPGTRVIARGLTRIEPIVTVLDGGEEL